MFKFRGFKASLNFAYTNKNKNDIENYPTGPENISLAGAYRANREEFFGYGSFLEPPKKITPAMVKLPPSREQATNLTIQPSKSTSDLALPSATLPPAVLSKSTPDISTDPRGRTTNENRNSTDFYTNKDGKKPTSKEQKLLERQQKKQKKIAEEKEAKLKKEREKAEKERERLEKERVREQEKAAKKDKAKREKKTKSKAPPLPKTPPPTAAENPPVILDQQPTSGSQLLTQQNTTNQSPQLTSQQPKTTNPLAQATPTPLTNILPPAQVISQSPAAVSEPPKANRSPKPKADQRPKSTKQQAAPSQPKAAQPKAAQPKAAQHTNPLLQPSQNYSSDTLDSNISRNTGPPPYDEVTPNTNDKAGNTSFGKRIDDTNNNWDLVSQHREQMNKPMARERRPKRLVMDLQFDSGFVPNKGDEKSEA